VVWDWVGGVPSRGKEESQPKSSSESCWQRQERSWCRVREERGRRLSAWKTEPRARKSTCKGGRRGRGVLRGKEQSRWSED